MTLGNPKVILFYVGLLPTFVNLQQLTPSITATSLGIVVGMEGLVLTGYAYFAAKTRHLFNEPQQQNLLNRISGSMMIAVGLALALKP